MTKQELVSSISEQFSITKKKSNEICDLIFKLVSKSLIEDREFEWPKFGKFRVNSLKQGDDDDKK